MENTNDLNIGAGNKITSFIVGLVSGIIVYITYIVADGIMETGSSFVSGAVFGVISSFYFSLVSKQYSMKQYAIWTFFSFLSFLLAYWSFWWIVVLEIGPGLPAGFSVAGLVGALVLVAGFRFSFFKLPFRNFRSIIVLLTVIPMLPYALGFDSHVNPFYFILFTSWQTAAIVFFASILSREFNEHNIAKSDASQQIGIFGKYVANVTKKNIAITASVGVVGLALLSQDTDGLLYVACQNGGSLWTGLCWNAINFLSIMLEFLATIFIPILFLFFYKDEVFVLWKNTLVVYLLIYLFIIMIVPWQIESDYLYEPINKGTIILIASIAYIIFSLVYVMYKNHMLKSK